MRSVLAVAAFVAVLSTGQVAYAQTVGAVSLTLSPASVTYGKHVRAVGVAEGAAPGEQVLLERATGELWVEAARGVTDEAGGFAIELTATSGGLFRARTELGGAVSEPLLLEVVPAVRVKLARGRAFVGARLTARVRPSSYTGTASIAIRNGARVVATAAARVRAGRLSTTLPVPGFGPFVAVLTLPPGEGLAGRTMSARVRVTARDLSVGASGADVRGLSLALARLRIRVPGISSTFSWSLVDSVIAFQKAYGMSRTGVVGRETWRKLGAVAVVRPRHRGPAAHIEVDKTRQILLDVRHGEVVAVIPVSSGATGNTPEGRHHIRWKALATSTWLGPAILYRTMTFYGNSFAIHGFPSVPAYPASHGCVRIPIWTADWLYDRSFVGETVYVYR
jgi:L,D-transpeptidase catalytic domain/Putative peptidoglycan binding domain